MSKTVVYFRPYKTSSRIEVIHTENIDDIAAIVRSLARLVKDNHIYTV